MGNIRSINIVFQSICSVISIEVSRGTEAVTHTARQWRVEKGKRSIKDVNDTESYDEKEKGHKGCEGNGTNTMPHGLLSVQGRPLLVFVGPGIKVPFTKSQKNLRKKMPQLPAHTVSMERWN